jgi:uncharacterized membrane protein
MPVVVGTFDTQTQAEAAVAGLKDMGFTDADLSVVSRAADPPDPPKDDEQRANDTVDASVAGAALGAVLGGFLLGPIGAVIGGTAAGGGVAAVLSSHGASDDEAREYEARLREGRYLVVVKTEDSTAGARAALDQFGAERIAVKRQ